MLHGDDATTPTSDSDEESESDDAVVEPNGAAAADGMLIVDMALGMAEAADDMAAPDDDCGAMRSWPSDERPATMPLVCATLFNS